MTLTIRGCGDKRVSVTLRHSEGWRRTSHALDEENQLHLHFSFWMHAHVCMYVCAYVCIYVCMHACVCMYDISACRYGTCVMHSQIHAHELHANTHLSQKQDPTTYVRGCRYSPSYLRTHHAFGSPGSPPGMRFMCSLGIVRACECDNNFSFFISKLICLNSTSQN